MKKKCAPIKTTDRSASDTGHYYSSVSDLTQAVVMEYLVVNDGVLPVGTLLNLLEEEFSKTDLLDALDSLARSQQIRLTTTTDTGLRPFGRVQGIAEVKP